MMRYSSERPNADVVLRCDSKRTNAEFFDEVASKTRPDERRAALLLVGGRDPLARAVRRAQGVLRYDRAPSYWSHAALLLGWPGEADDAFGVEIALDARGARRHTPERNGVTTFRLARYASKARYPNLGVFLFSFSGQGSRGLDDVIAAALEPNRERARYPWWDNLSPWARYAYAPDVAPNPLLEGVPLPAASLCEYAYAASGIDVVPGATANQTCPELLWATVRHWSKRLEEGGAAQVKGFAVLRDPHATPYAEAPSLADELRDALGGSRPGPAGER